MTVEKARLQCRDGGKHIEFMFNPKELGFEAEVRTADNRGAGSIETGTPKVSFSHMPAKTITISNILYDTYETGEDVIDKYIVPFQEATQFIKVDQNTRPPVYSFLWRKPKPYFDYCFVIRVSYKLTKFLADGTPVRAVINTLTLKETEKPNDSINPNAAKPDPSTDNVDTRSSKAALPSNS